MAELLKNTRTDEQLILHGFRWSAIAARLPGRTDNEIKNVWHTHLKKRLEPKPASQQQAAAPKRKPTKKQQQQQQQPDAEVVVLDGPTGSTAPVSPEQSSLSTSTTASSADCSAASSLDNNADSFTSEEDYQIEDSFWSETLAMAVDSSGDYSSGMEREDAPAAPPANDDEMDFWLKLFMQASDMQNNLTQI